MEKKEVTKILSFGDFVTQPSSTLFLYYFSDGKAIIVTLKWNGCSADKEIIKSGGNSGFTIFIDKAIHILWVHTIVTFIFYYHCYSL